MEICGNIVDLFERSIYPGKITVEAGKIKSIEQTPEKKYTDYIIPGLIDAHIHIESSMLVPGEFARAACLHGTTAAVSDPHEIANVLGVEGVEYMINCGKNTPIRLYYGAPSCVPATDFESSGANLGVEDIEYLFDKYDLKYLSEVMNFPGVIYDNPEVIAKIEAAKKRGKLIDGHAPSLTGMDLIKYASSGISTDHECFTIEEAREKAALGMKILIREGSAAKNFDALIPLIAEQPDMCMFCSDDKHPDDLIKGHINLLLDKAIDLGYDIFDVIRAATVVPAEHYGLQSGLLRAGDYADIVVLSDFNSFEPKQVYIGGVLAAEKGKCLIPSIAVSTINSFSTNIKSTNDFKIKAETDTIRIIEAVPGELITNSITDKAKIVDGFAESDIERDILKLAVVNRYKDTAPVVGFIKNIGIKYGAFASSVAHDSHNIIAVGTNDEDLTKVINAVIESKGGLAVISKAGVEVLPLPVAGLMSTEPCGFVAEKYLQLDRIVKELGSPLASPFMTLSFMSLLVIPKLKLSDKGLFDGDKFEFTNLFVK